jgi:Domain of unknown function (DUF4350)
VSAAPARRGTPAWVMPVVGVAVVVVAVLALGGPGDSDRPLDPRSDGRSGTSAYVALAEELGASVEITDRLPEDGDGTEVFLLLADLLDEDQHDELDGWVRDGGTLVVLDPGSDFAPSRTGGFDEVDDLPAFAGSRCDVDVLEGIAVEDVEPRRGGLLFDVPVGADACIGPGGDAYVVVDEVGDGTLVAVGGSGMFVNEALDEGENAPVVAALTGLQEGTELAVLEPGTVTGTGEDTLADLVPDSVWAALAQAGIAFLLYALWRSRRLGQPVAELVAAVGTLLDRSGSPQRAGDLLRADLRRWLADRFGVPPGTAPHVLASVVAQRTGADEARLAWALTDSAVADDDQLVVLAQTIDAIRQEVLTNV